jgi:transcription elongation GreA/GreB family factor
MKHGVDDEVSLNTARGEQTYVIVAVSYPVAEI